jgi:hypothetical protein
VNCFLFEESIAILISLSNEQGHELDILTSYHAIPTLHNETLQDLVNIFHSLLFREDDLMFLHVDIVEFFDRSYACQPIQLYFQGIVQNTAYHDLSV